MCQPTRDALLRPLYWTACPARLNTFTPFTVFAVSNIKLSDKTFTYSIAKGAIVDVSLTGTGKTRYLDIGTLRA